MRTAQTLSVTPYGVPAPPKGGAFLCGGKVCLLGSYPFRLLLLVAATFPKGTASVVAAKFLVALDALALRATACALSVKAYGFASSPKGRAKSTAGNFLFIPNTLAIGFNPWLSPWESWRGSA